MATEQIWGATDTAVVTTDDYTNTIEDTPGFPYEARTTVLGARVLYKIKEAMVAAGWQVISSSARQNYDVTAITNNVFNNGLHFSQSFDAPIVADTAYFYYDGGALGDPSQLPDYTLSYGDGTDVNLRQFISHPNPIFHAAGADLWITGSGVAEEDIYQVIYPGLVRDSRTASTKEGTSAKSVYSKAYAVYRKDSGNDERSVYYIPGRAWCLLRAPDGFVEEGTLGSPNKRYHILLDFVEHETGTTKNPHADTSLTATTGGTWKPQSFDAADVADVFGTKIAIYVFPEYDPENNPSDTNIFGIPAPWCRPTHRYEYGQPNSSVAYAADSAGALFTIIKSTAEGQYNINCLYSKVSTEELAASAGSFNIFVTTEGAPICSFTANKIADPLNKDGVSNGTKYFMFWSHEGRGISPIGVGSAFTSWVSNTPATTQGSQTLTRTNTLRKTIFDAREKYSHLFYYRLYDSSGRNYNPDRLATCVPSFLVPGGTADETYASIAQMFRDTPLAKATTDYTYVEWPLPLIDLNSSRNNYRYAGRMSDIKLGPSLAQSGLLAKQDGAENYDRLLFGGLWFACDLTDALII